MLDYSLEKEVLLCPLAPWRMICGSCSDGTMEQHRIVEAKRQRELWRGETGGCFS